MDVPKFDYNESKTPNEGPNPILKKSRERTDQLRCLWIVFYDPVVFCFFYDFFLICTCTFFDLLTSVIL